MVARGIDPPFGVEDVEEHLLPYFGMCLVSHRLAYPAVVNDRTIILQAKLKRIFPKALGIGDKVLWCDRPEKGKAAVFHEMDRSEFDVTYGGNSPCSLP